MTGGTKIGAQRARSLRPRCIRVINPETATPIYHLPSSLLTSLMPSMSGHMVDDNVGLKEQKDENRSIYVTSQRGLCDEK
jgi:hypothetical protein